MTRTIVARHGGDRATPGDGHEYQKEWFGGPSPDDAGRVRGLRDPRMMTSPG